jgi:hypothetical protein
MSFVDLKLLKMYNKRDAKELLSLQTSDIKGRVIFVYLLTIWLSLTPKALNLKSALLLELMIMRRSI